MKTRTTLFNVFVCLIFCFCTTIQSCDTDEPQDEKRVEKRGNNSNDDDGRGWAKCVSCNGTGRCSRCNGTGMSPKVAGQVCARCGGSGVCQTCDGAGGWDL